MGGMTVADEKTSVPVDSSLRDDIMQAINEALERAVDHLAGVERMVVSQAIQHLYPRLERRIRTASDEDLAAEIARVQERLNAILPPPAPPSGTDRKRRRNQTSAKHKGRRTKTSSKK